MEHRKEAMTKFSDLRKGDWVHVKSDETDLELAGTILEVFRGMVTYGRFTPTASGSLYAIRFEGNPSVVQSEDVYHIIEHRPVHKFPEVGKPIEMWNGKTPHLAELTKSIGFWDGRKYLGHKFDESVGRIVKICWDSAECSDMFMKEIEWRYIGE